MAEERRASEEGAETGISKRQSGLKMSWFTVVYLFTSVCD